MIIAQNGNSMYLSNVERQVMRQVAEHIEDTGGATCICCLTPKPRQEIKFVGASTREVSTRPRKRQSAAFCVCETCWETPEAERSKAIESNLPSIGVYTEW